MIICSCARISDRDVEAAIDWMRSADPAAVVTPGKVYRALGKSPVCGGCAPLLVSRMRASLQGRDAIPAELRGLRRELGRRKGDAA